MEVKAADVKTLRARTGAGMMDCKNALVETNGDFDKAEIKLKELGLAAAAKRSGKAANEGRIFSAVAANRAGLLEFSCETDFVARNEEFIESGGRMLDVVLAKNLSDADDEVNEIADTVRSRLKENITLKRFTTLEAAENDLVVDYIHGDGKIGVLVKLTLENAELKSDEKVTELAFNCALHVAAFNPAYLSRDQIDSAYMDEQESIFRKQAEGLDKPEKVLEGIVKGKLNKHLGEVVLLDQGFVKEEKTKVAAVLKSISSEIGGTVELTDYRYYRVGEDA